jgi:hypothetical protein
MNSFELFSALLHAEHESEVEAILKSNGYLDDVYWQPLGSIENNFATVGNQQSDPTAALVEKIINSMDAILMLECFKRRIDPEGPEAPQSMNAAIQLFFQVKSGQIGALSARERTKLADLVHLIAVGSKEEPCYIIIDKGEGQTPQRFPDTLLSIVRSNRLRIPFVQGKFNMGGTGVLPFCGTKKYELIASRRNPQAPKDSGDNTAHDWGFTLVRRLPPEDGRRGSMYVYLAPENKIPKFSANSICVLPGDSAKNSPAEPYTVNLDYGTCIKLYNYRWKAKSTATTEARYEIERYLHAPCLPFRITETRNYKANYYSTTLSGIWATLYGGEDEEIPKVEPGFPAPAELNLPDIGRLPYRLVVFKEEVEPRHVPHGIFFTLNGQVHGSLSTDFVSGRLKFDYLGRYLLISIDCTTMDALIREDFIMGSRDRIRQSEILQQIEDALEDELKNHSGLRELNAIRRKRNIEKSLESERDTVEAFQHLLKSDPTLASLFSAGTHLVTSTGPGVPQAFAGRKFPTFFRLVKEPKDGLTKPCPVNRPCRVDFETDAENEYFSRLDSPGTIEFFPPYICEHWSLWNGRLVARLKCPKSMKPGQLLPIQVTVTDIECHTQPFVCRFTLLAEKPAEPVHTGGVTKEQGQGPHGQGRQTAPRLGMPKINEKRKDEWANFTPPFNEYEALRVLNDGQGGYDFYLNIDNVFLLTEISRSRDDEKPLIKYWFKYGLVLCALGMLQQFQSQNIKEQEAEDSDRSKSNASLLLVNQASAGLSRVIVPIIRRLYRGPSN